MLCPRLLGQHADLILGSPGLGFLGFCGSLSLTTPRAPPTVLPLPGALFPPSWQSELSGGRTLSAVGPLRLCTLNSHAQCCSSGIPLETLSPTTHDDLRRACSAVQTTLASSLSARRTVARDSNFALWSTFRSSCSRTPYFDDTEDPIPWLLLWAARLRSGEASASHRPLRARSVEDAIRAVAQAHTLVGRRDPRCAADNTIDTRISLMLKAYAKEDPAPTRVKPLPVPLLRAASDIALHGNSAVSQALSDCLWIGFFFLNRPGEYANPTDVSAPFRICDVSLWYQERRLHYPCPDANQWLDATFCTLTFTKQKNAVRGEAVGHGRSSDPIACPVLALARRLCYLQLQQAPHTVPACTHFTTTGTALTVTSADITRLLRAACRAHPEFGIPPDSVSARSLRASGAMALLCDNVDSDLIRMLGRWRSDEMFRYLHLQAEPLMRSFAAQMLRGGNYSLLPPSEPRDVPLV